MTIKLSVFTYDTPILFGCICHWWVGFPLLTWCRIASWCRFRSMWRYRIGSWLRAKNRVRSGTVTYRFVWAGRSGSMLIVFWWGPRYFINYNDFLRLRITIGRFTRSFHCWVGFCPFWDWGNNNNLREKLQSSGFRVKSPRKLNQRRKTCGKL